jgi:hypothetical protein
MGPVAPRLRVNLILVPVGRAYRRALPISQRAELATAFAQGEARCASGQSLDEQQMEELMGLSADARTAYRLGVAGPDGLRAPAPLTVAVPLLLAEVLAEALAQAAHSQRHRLALRAALVTAFIYPSSVSDRARVRRARALGLTAETAPLPTSFGLTVGHLVGRLLLVGIQQVGLRRRAGRWGRVSLSSSIAAAAIRELRVRQDWNAAYKRAQGLA